MTRHTKSAFSKRLGTTCLTAALWAVPVAALNAQEAEPLDEIDRLLAASPGEYRTDSNPFRAMDVEESAPPLNSPFSTLSDDGLEAATSPRAQEAEPEVLAEPQEQLQKEPQQELGEQVSPFTAIAVETTVEDKTAAEPAGDMNNAEASNDAAPAPSPFTAMDIEPTPEDDSAEEIAVETEAEPSNPFSSPEIEAVIANDLAADQVSEWETAPAANSTAEPTAADPMLIEAASSPSNGAAALISPTVEPVVLNESSGIDHADMDVDVGAQEPSEADLGEVLDAETEAAIAPPAEAEKAPIAVGPTDPGEPASTPTSAIPILADADAEETQEQKFEDEITDLLEGNDSEQIEAVSSPTPEMTDAASGELAAPAITPIEESISEPIEGLYDEPLLPPLPSAPAGPVADSAFTAMEIGEMPDSNAAADANVVADPAPPPPMPVATDVVGDKAKDIEPAFSTPFTAIEGEAVVETAPQPELSDRDASNEASAPSAAPTPVAEGSGRLFNPLEFGLATDAELTTDEQVETYNLQERTTDIAPPMPVEADPAVDVMESPKADAAEILPAETVATEAPSAQSPFVAIDTPYDAIADEAPSIDPASPEPSNDEDESDAMAEQNMQVAQEPIIVYNPLYGPETVDGDTPTGGTGAGDWSNPDGFTQPRTIRDGMNAMREALEGN